MQRRRRAKRVDRMCVRAARRGRRCGPRADGGACGTYARGRPLLCLCPAAARSLAGPPHCSAATTDNGSAAPKEWRAAARRTCVSRARALLAAPPKPSPTNSQTNQPVWRRAAAVATLASGRRRCAFVARPKFFAAAVAVKLRTSLPPPPPQPNSFVYKLLFIVSKYHSRSRDKTAQLLPCRIGILIS